MGGQTVLRVSKQRSKKMSLVQEQVLAADLKKRWSELFSCSHSATSENLSTAASHLIGAYQQPSRHYHRLGHLLMMRAELGLSNTTDGPNLDFKDKRGVELAIDVHDIVQGLIPTFDVSDSERWVLTLLQAWGIDPQKEFLSLLPCLRATEHHPDKPPTTSDAKLVADADLAILGQTDIVYQKYAAGVSKEFGWVPEELFIRERIKVLNGFIKRPQIYWTDYFGELYEEKARQNISKELLELNEALRE